MNKNKIYKEKSRAHSKTERIRYYAGLFFMLDLADNYELKKVSENEVHIDYKIGSESLSVTCNKLDTVKIIAEWLVTLPKEIFDSKVDAVNQFNASL